MVRVLRSTVIDVPVETVWSVLRDFNGHDRWHPAVKESVIEGRSRSDRVGCVRKFRLSDGSELRERLLTLSDRNFHFSYCLLETPIPLFNYVAHCRLRHVTDQNTCFWEWEGRFDSPEGREDELSRTVGDDIYEAGFAALREHLETGFA